jgi:hypothetical protein
MTDTNAIDGATRRLQSALQALEAVLERRLEEDHRQAGLADQIHAIGVDRSRLACELDGAVARSRRLETANREVAERLEAAIDAIRTLLGPQDS